MQTTEVFVDQLLIGMVALVAILLPFHPSWLSGLPELGVTTSAAVVGVAYLLGILVDRAADSLTEGLEVRGRLLFSALRWRPLREDRLAFTVLGCEGTAARAAYLRTRYRLARALFALAPALTVAVVIAASPPAQRWSVWRPVGWLFATSVIYTGAIICVRRSVRHLPRAEDLAAYLDLDVGIRPELRARHDPALPALAIVLTLGAVIGLLELRTQALERVTPLLALVGAGALLTVVAGLAYCRIRRAFMSLLASAGPLARGPKQQRGPAGRGLGRLTPPAPRSAGV